MRITEISRKTKETNVYLKLNLDGTGICDSNTGIPFLDHMLEQVALHGLINLSIAASGDLEIDLHHTVEDVGISFGKALKELTKEKKGLNRYGYSYVPLDESLSRVVIDLSGRPNLQYHAFFSCPHIGNFSIELIREFFQGLVNHADITLHIDNLRGFNAHHQCETIFKSFGRSLKMAVKFDTNSQRNNLLPSTKGIL